MRCDTTLGIFSTCGYTKSITHRSYFSRVMPGLRLSLKNAVGINFFSSSPCGYQQAMVYFFFADSPMNSAVTIRKVETVTPGTFVPKGRSTMLTPLGTKDEPRAVLTPEHPLNLPLPPVT